MKTKILGVKQVLIEPETYPRNSIDFVTLSRYLGAMESGAVFPPITVGFLNGKYYLIDGRHRLEATKGRKETHITAEIVGVKDKKEIFLEAVKRNITHGKQFSTQDVTTIIITLEKWKLSQEEIAEIVKIPADRLTPFVAKRAVLITGTDGGIDEQVALKKTISHLAGSVQDKGFVGGQRQLVTADQLHLINTLIKMIKNNWFDMNDKKIKEKLVVLSSLIEKEINLVSIVKTQKPKKK